MSELFTRSTALKFGNAVAISRHDNYCLVIKDSAHSNYIESVTQQWRKSAPPILSTSHCEFMVPIRMPTLEKPSLWHLFTRQIVPLVCEELLT